MQKLVGCLRLSDIRRYRADMSRINPNENPFELSKASNYSDSEILEFWVDILGENGGLTNLLQPKSITPLLLLGGKGSGKTHLMRFCSAPVQTARFHGDLRSAVRAEGYLGVYVHAEGINTHKFSGKGQSPEAWAAIYSMYFELWLVTSLLEVLASYLHGDPSDFDEGAFVSDVANLFDSDVSAEFSTFQALLKYLERVRKDIDYRVNKSSVNRSLEGIDFPFSNGKLVFGIPELFTKHLPSFAGKTIVYLIDEVENLTEDQQRFLNTLIRYRKGPATIRVGARLYGIKTHETLGSGEPIRANAEFKEVFLDKFLREHKKAYQELLTGLVRKRVQMPSAETDDLGQYFEKLERADYQRVSLDLARRHDREGKPRPYFKKLSSHLAKIFGADEEARGAIIESLRVSDDPFLERANIFVLYKNWSKDRAALINAAKKIGQDCRNHRSGINVPSDYTTKLDHFASDILAQLYRDFRQSVPYAGWDTLVKLSQGIPRNFLTILQYVIRRSQFAGERPFAQGVISIESQSSGVRDGAQWFWEDANPDGAGREVREAIEALGLFFRNVRFSESPSECDLCTFSLDLQSMTPTSLEVLKIAENWSYLIKASDDSKAKNDRGVGEKYQLSPMLAPKWEVSENRRGNIELSANLANAIFDKALRENLLPKVKARIAVMSAPDFSSGKSLGQEELFT